MEGVSSTRPSITPGVAATALATLRRLAQGSRAACLAMGARGLLRALKGLLGPGLSPNAAATDSSDDNDDKSPLTGQQPQGQRARLLLLEALRLWRVALRHGADLESLLDALALLAPTAGEAEDDTRGDGGALVLPSHWPPAARAAWHRALEQACGTVAGAVRWQRGQAEQQGEGKGEEEGKGALSPPYPAAALAPVTLAECCGRLAALATGAWRAEAEGVEVDLGDLGEHGHMCGLRVWEG